MATKKSESKYLEDAPDSDGLKTISARVPLELYNKFQQAVKLANEHKKNISITKVVQTAMRDAITEVSDKYGQGDLLK